MDDHDWIYTAHRDVQVPPVSSYTKIYALGVYGDVYGPLPLELFAEEAWKGCMANRAHDLIAYALAE